MSYADESSFCFCSVGMGLGVDGQSIISRRQSSALTAGCSDGVHDGGWLV